MDHTGDRRQLVRIQVTAIAIAAAMAIAVVAMTATQAGASATDNVVETGGNGPTGYFPDLFVNQGSEIPDHIEAF